MKNVFRLFAVVVVLSTAACAAKPSGGGPAAPGPQQTSRTQPTQGQTSAAQPGDTVYLVRHYIRPERRTQFEDFVQTVMWPAFQKSATAQPARRDMLRAVRLLQPVQPDEDGVLTYTFLLDPYVKGESYNVLELLRKVYPDDEARRQYSRYTETWARDFTTHAYVQTRGQAAQ